MKIERLVVGPLQTNVYAVVNDNNQALIIDPGADGHRIVNWINENNWQVQAILITHGHFDHIGALDDVRASLGVEAYIGSKDQELLSRPDLNVSALFMPQLPVTQDECEQTWPVEDGEVRVGNFKFRVESIPGHTPGSSVYIFDDLKAVFTGDVLFKSSIGRTDFPQGNLTSLLTGIKDKLLTLPGDYSVYPGHNDPTTIEAEKLTNPFLQ